MIKGIENLSNEQKCLMLRVNKKHTDAVGTDYKDGMEIIECWIDENSIVCVKLKNNSWYHYYSTESWG